jgi:hypothetical protein
MRVKVLDGELDADFDILDPETSESDFDIVLHSRGHKRNPDYALALAEILRRLALAGCSIVRITVDSPIARKLPLEERTLRLAYPIAPINAMDDIGVLRRQISRAQLNIGQLPGAKEGNGTRRIRICVASIGVFDAGSFGGLIVGSGNRVPAVEADPSSVLSDESSGQGYGLSKDQRDAVEEYAMRLASEHLKRLGWQIIKDTSRNRPYDYYCSTLDTDLYVEVKGTTSRGMSIILTAGEVRHNRTMYPHTALIIVSGICLSGISRADTSGGTLNMVSPWSVKQSRLQVTQYRLDTTDIFAPSAEPPDPG